MTATEAAGVVTIERLGDVALIRIDNQPVNAAGVALRKGVVDAVAALNEAGDVKAIGL